MILPIVAYGHPILRKIAQPITPDYPGLAELLDNMWETMYHSNGVGLAAPQINKEIRIFVVDTEQIVESFDEQDLKDYPNEKPIKQTFINAEILEKSGELWSYNEGCLSIPKVRENVKREQTIKIKFLDADFKEHIMEFDGITARVILHEYDHIEGKLFIDHLAPLKRKLLKKKLNDIAAGKVNMGYRMIYPK